MMMLRRTRWLTTSTSSVWCVRYRCSVHKDRRCSGCCSRNYRQSSSDHIWFPLLVLLLLQLLAYSGCLCLCSYWYMISQGNYGSRAWPVCMHNVQWVCCCVGYSNRPDTAHTSHGFLNLHRKRPVNGIPCCFQIFIINSCCIGLHDQLQSSDSEWLCTRLCLCVCNPHKKV